MTFFLEAGLANDGYRDSLKIVFNENSGGGQWFFQGAFHIEGREPKKLHDLDKKTLLLVLPTVLVGSRDTVNPHGNRHGIELERYPIANRGGQSTSMKILIKQGSVSAANPSDLISGLFMLPVPARKPSAAAEDRPAVSSSNYRLQSITLKAVALTDEVATVAIERLTFSTHNISVLAKHSDLISRNGESTNYFGLDIKSRVGALRALSAREGIPSDIKDVLTFFTDIYDGHKEFNLSECRDKTNALMEKLSHYAPFDYAGDTDVLPIVDREFSDGMPGFADSHSVASPSLQRDWDVILYGVPGSGKSYVIDNEYCSPGDVVERVVFHPDYLYSDFVGQILPKVRDSNVRYEFVPGPLTRILRSAYRSPGVRHILIIEEINRGNAAAIFGDIFQLLDRDSRGESSYGVHNPDVARQVYDDESRAIRFPSNLRLLATMNTSDQNVFPLDTAFQRRWAMRNVPNDFESVAFGDTEIFDTGLSWQEFGTVVNGLLVESASSVISTEDKRLGAYFISQSEITFESNDSADEAVPVRRFAEKVLKYLWDDAFKFDRHRFFSNAITNLEDLVSEFVESEGVERWGKVLQPHVLNWVSLTETSPAEDSAKAILGEAPGRSASD